VVNSRRRIGGRQYTNAGACRDQSQAPLSRSFLPFLRSSLIQLTAPARRRRAQPRRRLLSILHSIANTCRNNIAAFLCCVHSLHRVFGFAGFGCNRMPAEYLVCLTRIVQFSLALTLSTLAGMLYLTFVIASPIH
jgi:hypothetical protein